MLFGCFSGQETPKVAAKAVGLALFALFALSYRGPARDPGAERQLRQR